jgi:predicted RNase H-like nuclease (RuvC/YqgF family)
LLDIEGNFVAMWSDKNISRSDLAKFISEFGTPLIVSGDTNPVPRSVEKVSALFSAKLFYPELTLSRKDKYELTRFFKPELDKAWSNRHERDALASALHAWGRIRNLMDRIDKKVRPYGNKELEWHVKANVILKGENIDNSVESFMKDIKSGK